MRQWMLRIGAGVALAGMAAVPAAATMVGSAHDFLDDGFSGGGLCAECHVPHGAQAERLWARPGNTGYATAPERLCMDCHDGSLPTGGGWDTVSGVTPPAFPHSSDPKYENCGDCHDHRRSFSIPNDDCLVCHTTQANGGLFDDATEARLEVDRFFNGVGAVNDGSILSQHNIRYQADGDINTPEDASLNECKKCHGDGTKHPSDAAFLVYPDDRTASGKAAGDPVPRSTDYSAYQDFCLSCHDGVDQGTANPSFQRFNGGIPAGQVAPSDPSDPAAQQASAPWQVAAVPPKDANAGAPYANAAPYFDYFETNGHGRVTGLEGGTMDVTCLAGGAGQGCHAAHGTTNRFLLDELFGSGIDTVGGVVNQVCYGCHVEADLGDPDNAILAKNLFHGSWTSSSEPLHAPAGVGMARWRALSGFMDIADPFSDPNGGGAAPDAYAETGILPFYAGPSAPIENRRYTPTLGSDYVACVTCHDPHGTSAVYWDFKGQPVSPPSATENTQAMLRKFPTSWDYLDPLCSECHSR